MHNNCSHEVGLCGLGMLAVMISACATNHPVIHSKTPIGVSNISSGESVRIVESAAKEPEATTIIGGWAPVFFESLDKVQLNRIIHGLKTHRIKSLRINYFIEAQSLALQIQRYLNRSTGENFALELITLQNNQKTQYNRNQVIITLYFNAVK